MLGFGNIVNLVKNGALSNHVVRCIGKVVSNQPHEFLDKVWLIDRKESMYSCGPLFRARGGEDDPNPGVTVPELVTGIPPPEASWEEEGMGFFGASVPALATEVSAEEVEEEILDLS